jgi:hypothetical protein
MKRFAIALTAAMMLAPFAAQADIVQLSAVTPVTTVVTVAPAPSPLMCYDFTKTLKMGSTGYEVRGLQYAMIHEGWTIPVSEYGTFGSLTMAAINAFQTKYSAKILANGATPTGMTGSSLMRCTDVHQRLA